MDLGPHKRPIPPPQPTPHVPVYSCWGKLEEFICCQLVLNLRLVFISASKTAPSAFHLCYDAESCFVWGVLENGCTYHHLAAGDRYEWRRPILFLKKRPFHNDLHLCPAALCSQLPVKILDQCTSLIEHFFIILLAVLRGAQCWTCYEILTFWF